MIFCANTLFDGQLLRETELVVIERYPWYPFKKEKEEKEKGKQGFFDYAGNLREEKKNKTRKKRVAVNWCRETKT